MQQPGDRGEFSNYTYRRFDGLTQSRHYEDKYVCFVIIVLLQNSIVKIVAVFKEY